MSKRTSGGCGGREEGTNGLRANEVRVCGAARGDKCRLNFDRHAQRGRTSAGEGKVKERV